MDKQFRICDIFEKIQTEKIRRKAGDFPTEWSEEYCIPLLTAGIENQGLARFAKPSDCPTIIRNCISVSANGANSGATFYQPSDFAVLQDAYAVQVIDHEIANEQEGLYLTAALNKAIKDNHDWVNKAGWNNIKEDIVELPVIESPDPDHKYTVDDIDWQYMQDRIAELEQDRIAELEQDRIAELDAYLKVTGLEDYTLTEEDKEVLSLSSEAVSDEGDALETDRRDGKIRFGKFTLGALFTSATGDVDLQQKDINGKGQFFINSGVDNRGIKGRTDKPARIFPANTITIDFWGNVYYRDFEYKMATHNHVFSLSGDVIKNRFVGLYITGILSNLSRLFSYSNMATWNKLKSLEISLPVTPDGDIDFDYMERYIRAIEKLTIADVVKYRDRELYAAKQAVC